MVVLAKLVVAYRILVPLWMAAFLALTVYWVRMLGDTYLTMAQFWWVVGLYFATMALNLGGILVGYVVWAIDDRYRMLTGMMTSIFVLGLVPLALTLIGFAMEGG